MGKTGKTSRKSKTAWASLKGATPTPYKKRNKLETATDLEVFARTLHRLDSNCKKTIHSLTLVAMDLEKDGLEKEVVYAMQIHILTAPPNFVVPCLFVMDCLMKNSTELSERNTNYPKLISAILACVVIDALNKPMTVADKRLVFRTRLSWEGVVSSHILKKIDEAVQSVDERWQPKLSGGCSVSASHAASTQVANGEDSDGNHGRKIRTALREKDRIKIAARNDGVAQSEVPVPVGLSPRPDRKRRLSELEEDDQRVPKLAKNGSGNGGKCDTPLTLAQGHSLINVVTRSAKENEKMSFAAKMDDLSSLMEAVWRITPSSSNAVRNVFASVDESEESDFDELTEDFLPDGDFESEEEFEMQEEELESEEEGEELESEEELEEEEEEELLSDTDSPDEEKVSAMLFSISSL